MIELQEKVLELHNNGLSYNQIAKSLNMNKSTVAYYIKRFDNEKYLHNKEIKDKQRLEYEQIVCNVFLEQKNLYRTCIFLNKRPTNTNYKYIMDILNRYNISIDNVVYDKPKKRQKLDYKDIFKENSSLKNSSHLKDYIIKYNLKEEQCEECGITTWNNKKITLQVHHINGNNTDNRIENLKILCPNCHSQTENFCAKKIKKEKIKKEKIRKENTNIPLKDELLENFKEKGSFKQVGIFYNVSDNAVKKWFKKYNLPTSSPEIRKIIIEKYGPQPQWYSYRNSRDYSKSIEKLGYKIEIYNKEGKLLITCRSINEASRFTNINSNTISRYLQGKQIRNENFIFKKIN